MHQTGARCFNTLLFISHWVAEPVPMIHDASTGPVGLPDIILRSHYPECFTATSSMGGRKPVVGEFGWGRRKSNVFV